MLNLFISNLLNAANKNRTILKKYFLLFLSWEDFININQLKNYLNLIKNKINNLIFDILNEQDKYDLLKYYKDRKIQGILFQNIFNKEANINDPKNNDNDNIKYNIVKEKDILIKRDLDIDNIKNNISKNMKIFDTSDVNIMSIFDNNNIIDTNKIKNISISDLKIIEDNLYTNINYNTAIIKGENDKFKCLKCGIKYTNRTDILSHLHNYFNKSDDNHINMNIQFLEAEEFINNDKINISLKIEENKIEDLKNYRVIVSDELLKSRINCKICKEKILIYFDDTIQKWVYKNCLKVLYNENNIILHKECFDNIEVK